MNFTLDPKRVLGVLLGIIFVLFALHLTQTVAFFYIDDFEVFEEIKMLDFDYEHNLPAFYSSVAILFCAALLWCISTEKLQTRDPFKLHWCVLAIIFTYLGIDEALALHEKVGDFFDGLDLVKSEGFLYFAWVIPYSAIMILFVMFYAKFVLALPRQSMILFVGSGGLFVGGAMGVEVFSAREADLYGYDSIVYHVLYTIEELCEMIGMALFCFALLRYIQSQHGHININFALSAEQEHSEK